MNLELESSVVFSRDGQVKTRSWSKGTEFWLLGMNSSGDSSIMAPVNILHS